MRKYLPAFLLSVLSFCAPAFAGVSVSFPGNGSSVSSPFQLSAEAASCSGQPISAMGYSLDNSPDSSIVYGASMDSSVSSGSGSHTLHVKAWGSQGAVCVTDLNVQVSNVVSAAVIPSAALSLSSLEAMDNWKVQSDPTVGSGSASGWMALSSSPSRSGHSRKFVTSFTNNSGELYHLSFGDDAEATHFFYDAWLYLDNSAEVIGNIEMDMNQTMSNGQTVIYGIQCDGWTSTWDYTKNAGTPSHPSDQWVHSGQYCNPRTWGRNTWHHVQVSYSRNDSGVVTYHSVWLDGKELPLNATVPSAFALGWGPTLLTNFQIDGYGAKGTATVYVDGLSIYRW